VTLDKELKDHKVTISWTSISPKMFLNKNFTIEDYIVKFSSKHQKSDNSKIKDKIILVYTTAL
jgi:hypothetical protein